MLLQDLPRRLKLTTAAENKIPQINSSSAATEVINGQFEEDFAQHEAPVVDAKKTMATATAIREKEAAAVTTELSDLKTDIAALAKARAFFAERSRQNRIAEETDLLQENAKGMYLIHWVPASLLPAAQPEMHLRMLEVHKRMLLHVAVNANMSAPDRKILIAFLSQGQGDAPQSSSIAGILRQMKGHHGDNLGRCHSK